MNTINTFNRDSSYESFDYIYGVVDVDEGAWDVGLGRQGLIDAVSIASKSEGAYVERTDTAYDQGRMYERGTPIAFSAGRGGLLAHLGSCHWNEHALIMQTLQDLIRRGEIAAGSLHLDKEGRETIYRLYLIEE